MEASINSKQGIDFWKTIEQPIHRLIGLLSNRDKNIFIADQSHKYQKQKCK